ncbi:MAG: tRNA glutamyl-Q(34) synthetase GluQRS [Alteromonadaceae bacterium]|nr:MAG: tRNA glutamyl-Q(34) synthetase GluQRS [Alteromonadaceae bacterium]
MPKRKTPPQKKADYIGRFAPSPSGDLHLGSLTCALASYLDARKNHGNWLVRIEDIDPPREQKGATQSILSCIKAHGLNWDGDILYQSQRSSTYHQTLKALTDEQFSYPCTCNRKRIANLSPSNCYDGHCKTHSPKLNAPASIRLDLVRSAKKITVASLNISFYDLIQGEFSEDLGQTGDFVIHRKDGLFAYQLAVVVDDIHQGITHIVRGDDLLDCTPKQIFLTQLLKGKQATYAHIPVVNDDRGLKLSKQNHATAANPEHAHENILLCLKHLGLKPNSNNTTQNIPDLLQWATEHWNLNKLSNKGA